MALTLWGSIISVYTAKTESTVLVAGHKTAWNGTVEPVGPRLVAEQIAVMSNRKHGAIERHVILNLISQPSNARLVAFQRFIF